MQRIEVSKHKSFDEAARARDSKDDGAIYQIRRVSEGFKLVRRVNASAKAAKVEETDELGYTVPKRKKRGK